ncbi:PAS domain-containing sensor histidine kinase [Pseudomonas nicosulfuronedens]
MEGGAREEPESAEQELDDEQRRELGLLRNILEAIPYPVSVRDIHGRILYCNETAHVSLGKTREEVIGNTLADLGIFANNEEARLLGENARTAIASGLPIDGDVEFQSTKQRKVVHFWSRPYRDGQDNLVGAITGAQDITHRDDLVRNLRILNARSESVSRGKSQYLSGMSGELQGPLQNISAMIDLALNQDDPARRREPLLVAQTMAGNLLNLLEDLSLLNRLESGRLALSPEELDLRALIERQLELIEDTAQSKGVALQVDFSLALNTRVWCDASRLRQVLHNLLSNALKFTEQGSVHVGLLARGKGQGLVEVQIDIADSGIGMTEQEKHEVFEPFALPLDEERVRQGGTGLGLALSRALVELMDGSLELSSQPGAGTTFSIKLLLPGAEA